MSRPKSKLTEEQLKGRARKNSYNYYWKNPEKRRAVARERASRMPLEERRMRKRQWIANNRESARRSGKKTKLKAQYGLTIEQYEAMIAVQGHACAICRKPNPSNIYGWYIDHCHATNKVRGILCHPCNTMLGCAKDDAGILASAIAYLGEHR